jgi:broad specificity phosphatase PhoE
MRVTGIRHGEAKSNVDIEGGHVGSDHPLTKDGRAQAEARARKLGQRAIPLPRTLFHSPYRRTTETAHIIAEMCSDIQDVVPDDRLREIQKGVWHGRPVPEVMELEGQISEEEKPFFRPPSSDERPGENWGDVANRGVEFVVEKAEENADGEVMFVSHNHPILAVTGKLLGIEVARWEDRPLNNGGLITIRRTLSGWIEEVHEAD